MIETIFESKTMSFYYEPENHLFLAIYKGFAMPEEVKQVHEEVVSKALQKYKPKYWLSDSSAGLVSHPDSQKYLIETFIPKTSQLGIKKVATVLSDNIFGELSLRKVMESMKNTPHEYFKDIGSAKTWLLKE